MHVCHIGNWCLQGSEGGLGAPGTEVVVNCIVVLVGPSKEVRQCSSLLSYFQELVC